MSEANNLITRTLKERVDRAIARIVPLSPEDVRQIADDNRRLEARALELKEVNATLLAYAECQEAHDAYDLDGSGFTKGQLDDVFVKHGLEAPVMHRHGQDQLRELRVRALARATGPDEPKGERP